MKKKTGFTLIELLAVIVILAIIALIAVPVILNILDKSNKSAFKDTAYGIISAGELYFAEQQLELNGMSSDATFVWPNNLGTLQVKGNVPDGTALQVNTKGQVSLGMTNGRYCITKGYSDNDITITEDEECYFPGTFGYLTTTEHACIAKGQTCTPGETLFTIKVNKNETKNFYVLNDDGNRVTLIMSENLGNAVAWIDGTDYTTENNKDETPDVCNSVSCNDEGPVTAINYLDELTDDEWSNIPKIAYTYSGLAENGQRRKYEDITRNMRARMITYSEAKTLGCTTSSCPSWLYGGAGYWTSTSEAGGYHTAWVVRHVGSMNSYNGDGFHSATNHGVRPVIELSK